MTADCSPNNPSTTSTLDSSTFSTRSPAQFHDALDTMEQNHFVAPAQPTAPAPGPALTDGHDDTLGPLGGFEAAPHHAVPEYTIPEYAIPERAIPEYNIPERAVPEYNIPERAIPEYNVPERAIPEYTIPERAIPEYTLPAHTIPEHSIPTHNGFHEQHYVQSQPSDHGIGSSPRSHYPSEHTDSEPTARYETPPIPAPAISRPPSGLSGQATAYGADQASRAGSNGPAADAQNPGRNHVVIKVGMVGDAQIGKTSLMVKYVEGSWDEDYIQTLGVNFMEKTISIRNTEITFSIWDLGGQREFVNMLPLVCNDAVAILFMFDLTRKSTLNSIKEWYRQGRGFNKTAIPVLVGTKYDHFVNLSREEQEEISNQV